jgi:hypothetical protein
MSNRQKKALEITLRDAMDGMEALASLYAYRRLPEDLEILGIGEDPVPEAPQRCAEVIELALFRGAEPARHPPEQNADTPGQRITNKIITL